MLSEFAEENNAGLLILTESHLTKDVCDAEVAIDGFEIFRSDREGYRNGGVIIYAKSHIQLGLKVLLSLSLNKIDVLILESKVKNMIIVCVYRPPDSNYESFDCVMRRIEDVIEEYGGPGRTLVVAGDFNLPIINWKEGEISGGTREQQRQASILTNFAEKLFMEQLVEEGTRNANILDLFFTNNDEIVLKVEVEPQSIISDHKLQIITTSFLTEDCVARGNDEKDSLHQLNFFDNKIEWEEIKEKLSKVQWIQILKGLNPTEIYCLILKSLIGICLENIPRKKIKKKSRIPKDRKLLMRKKCNMKKKYKSSFDEHKNSILKEIETIEEKLKLSHKMEAEKKEHDAISKIKENPKYFYRYAREKSVVKSPIGPFIQDNKTIVEPKEKAEILQRQYLSVYSSEGYEPEIVNEIIKIHGPRSVETLSVTRKDIETAIDTLSSTSASGPDGVPAVLMKNCKNVLSQPLAILWQESLNTGIVPPNLKSGCIVPIHKGGDKCLPKNYRPITLTSHIIKVFEKIIVKILVDYMNSVGLFNSRQHGFRQQRSCLSQLLEHYQLIIQCMESGEEIPVVYLDFCKAFDKVDHRLVLEKLRAIGVSGNLLKWIGSFLLERKQVVMVDKVTSEVNGVNSGVPQGSVLGPLLFLVLISDIDVELKYSKASSFADDTKIVGIYPVITQSMMQEELEKIYQWAHINCMKFNDAKFEHLHYKVSRSSANSYELLSETGLPINKPDNVRDLGVIMGDEATFAAHIEGMTAKARRQAGWILRTFSARDKLTMMTLYKALVRPIVEYCSQLWSPSQVGLIRKVESVQRNFTARIHGMAEKTYWDRLKELDLYSLERRRERYCILYVYKILAGLTPNFEENRFRVKTTLSERRGLHCQIPNLARNVTGRVKTLADQSFAVRGPKLFNELPKDLRSVDRSFDAFKGRLDKFLSSVPDQPSLPGYYQQVVSNCLLDQIQQLRRDGAYYSL